MQMSYIYTMCFKEIILPKKRKISWIQLNNDTTSKNDKQRNRFIKNNMRKLKIIQHVQLKNGVELRSGAPEGRAVSVHMQNEIKIVDNSTKPNNIIF